MHIEEVLAVCVDEYGKLIEVGCVCIEEVLALCVLRRGVWWYDRLIEASYVCILR